METSAIAIAPSWNTWHRSARPRLIQVWNAQDAEIKARCKNILSSQQAEIDRMKARLSALGR
jgi:hypothetical protein